MILVICEKPSQARDIARHLNAGQRNTGYLEGNGYQVTWCVGHLLELAPPAYYRADIQPWRMEKLPVIPTQWQWLVSPRTEKQFRHIETLLKKTQQVIIASDPDREGEAIVREILERCQYTGHIERLWLSALDEISIAKAFAQLKPGHETECLYQAARARAASDWLIGINGTMAMSTLYGVNSVLSVGRVQTPTLQLVVERDRVINAFKAQDYFVLKVQFATQASHSFWTTWRALDAVLDKNGHCLDEQVVASIAAKVEGEPGVIQSINETEKQQKAPVCFSLSTLQKKASSLWGYSAKQTLILAQSLYETHKAITYPRTDNGYLPEEQRDEANTVLNAIAKIDNSLQPLVKRCDARCQSLVWNSKKVTAHHGIIPTHNETLTISNLSPEEFNLYDLIRRYYIAQFLGDFVYMQRDVVVLCAGEVFTAVGRTPIKAGWKQAFSNPILDDDNEDMSDDTIPGISNGDVVDNQETVVAAKQTKPPAHFTEGTLIDAMKNVGQGVEDTALKKQLKDSHGIGTEATRANILDTLFKRGYLQRQAKYVRATEKGHALIELVPDSLKNPVLTAQWEQALEKIVHGDGGFDTFVATQEKLLNDMLAQLRKKGQCQPASALQLQSDSHNGKVYLCPVCQAVLRRLSNKKGHYFWGCSHYPKCDFTTSEKHGKPRLS